MEGIVLLKQYADYDLWANKRLVERLGVEPADVLDRNVASSFPSLRLTVLHMRDAANTWLKRLLGQPYTWPAGPEMDLADLLRRCEAFHDHVSALSGEDLSRMVIYRDLRGNEHVQPVWQILMHCLNHNTQHRGQLITMMRALALERIPNVDLIGYQRSVK